MIDLSTLVQPIDKDKARAQLVANLVTLGIPADQWIVGGPLSTILTVVAWIYASFSSLMVAFVSAGFLGFASGGWLTLLAYYVYGVERPAATFATGTETFTNTGGGIYTIAPGQAIVKNTSTGQLYTNTATIILGPVGSSTSSTTVGIAAQSAGTIANALPGQIDRIVSPSMPGVIVGNPVSVVGLDAMSDAALRLLCTNKLGALGVRGVRGAYYYAISVATNAITGAPVNINRSFVSANSHTGVVTIYVASPTGAADVNDVAGVVTSVEANARPDAVTVNVSSASAISYAPAITIWAYVPTGVTAAAAAAAAATAITTFVKTYPIGGVSAADDANPTLTGVFADGVRAAAGSGLIGIGGQLLSSQGVTDLTLGPGQVPSYGATVNVRIIPQGVATT